MQRKTKNFVRGTSSAKECTGTAVLLIPLGHMAEDDGVSSDRQQDWHNLNPVLGNYVTLVVPKFCCKSCPTNLFKDLIP